MVKLLCIWFSYITFVQQTQTKVNIHNHQSIPKINQMSASHNKILNCLTTKGVEFIATDKNVVKAFHNGRDLMFHELPAFAYETIRGLMRKPKATLEEMQVFAYERWGGVDDVADIDEHGSPSDPEFVPGHSKTYCSNGVKISKAQMRVLQYIQHDNKQIAEKLYMSPYTVARHCQDMFTSTGIQNRTQLGVWATQKGII